MKNDNIEQIGGILSTLSTLVLSEVSDNIASLDQTGKRLRALLAANANTNVFTQAQKIAITDALPHVDRALNQLRIVRDQIPPLALPAPAEVENVVEIKKGAKSA